MVEIIARGWSQFYDKYTQMYRACTRVGSRPLVMTTDGGDFIEAPEKGKRLVYLRCGWKERGDIRESLTGSAVLTKKQVLFLHRVSPDITAVQAVGREWPGYEKAIKTAAEVGAL